jgi:hypothetical protein
MPLSCSCFEGDRHDRYSAAILKLALLQNLARRHSSVFSFSMLHNAVLRNNGHLEMPRKTAIVDEDVERSKIARDSGRPP